MADMLTALIQANAAASVAVLAVLLLRQPLRRCFGAELTYVLWLAPLLAAAASFLPARDSEVSVRHAVGGLSSQQAQLLLGLWLVGAVASVVVLAIAQLAFLRLARAGQAGPAVVGVVCPRIVMPSDSNLYTREERAIIRAHEREHIDRGDTRARAWMAACQCVAWFNPLVHLAVRVAALDQELACDAAVLRRSWISRPAYAEALLKAQVGAAPFPLGPHWAAHPLETRIAALVRPARDDSGAGAIVVCTTLLAAVLLSWGAKPPVERHAWISDKTAAWYEQPEMHVLLVTYGHSRP